MFYVRGILGVLGILTNLRSFLGDCHGCLVLSRASCRRINLRGPNLGGSGAISPIPANYQPRSFFYPSDVRASDVRASANLVSGQKKKKTKTPSGALGAPQGSKHKRTLTAYQPVPPARGFFPVINKPKTLYLPPASLVGAPCWGIRLKFVRKSYSHHPSKPPIIECPAVIRHPPLSNTLF